MPIPDLVQTFHSAQTALTAPLWTLSRRVDWQLRATAISRCCEGCHQNRCSGIYVRRRSSILVQVLVLLKRPLKIPPSQQTWRRRYLTRTTRTTSFAPALNTNKKCSKRTWQASTAQWLGTNGTARNLNLTADSQVRRK